MFDKLEKHNNKKITYVVTRRFNAMKNAILSFFNLNKGSKEAVFGSNYLLSPKK